MSNHDTHAEEHAHGHPVVSWQIQLGVLIALLFFTFTTVLFYNMESWVEHAFDIHLPGWVNIVGAMSIATVKAILVCMYFMGLKYDKALNTFAMLFCLFCVALFLGFSMIDLETRDRVETWRKAEASLGGTGKALDSPPVNPSFDADPSPEINTGGLSIVEFRRQQKLEEKGSEEAFWNYYYKKHGHNRHKADVNNFFATLGYDHHVELSTANKSVPRHGITPGLFSAVDPNEAKHHDDHGDDHSDDHSDDHIDDHADESDH